MYFLQINFLVIFTITGLFGFFLVFIIPCSYSLLSALFLKKNGIHTITTQYSGLKNILLYKYITGIGWYSMKIIVGIVLLIGLGEFLFSVIDACDPSLFEFD